MKKLMLILSVACLAGCYSDSKEELAITPTQGPSGSGCDTANVTFAAKVKPILTASCATAGCHNATTKAKNYDLSTYDGAKASVNEGRLLGAIKHATGFQPMPQGGNKLDDCSIAIVEKWVNLGAKND
ncbi:MAG: hypothetical protein EOP56_08475 [Sphingobacteriales bacterium]|nr:MAG: hypothetical protein EOP56_08475 [Sphingobacteriales bacterium]